MHKPAIAPTTYGNRGFNRFLRYVKHRGGRPQLHTGLFPKLQTNKNVCSYLDVLRDLVSALLMTSEGADCRL